jgi:hypothetical protein
MSRTARKPQVSAQFFRVDGADQETGQETYLVLQAPTKPHAEKLAREQGLLISAVRVARPDDWSAPPPPPPEPAPPAETYFDPPPPVEQLEPAPEMDYAAGASAEPTPFVDAPSASQPAPPALEPVRALPSPTTTTAGRSSAAAVVLGCIGGAFVLAGVLALVLALWPDNAVRNEFQQIDFRVHELSQTVIGAMLVLSGIVVFALSIMSHLLSKRNPQA